MDKQFASIQLKLAKAKTLLTEVQILVDHNGFNSIINRLYYACFHATNALLLTKNLQSKTHKGLSTLLYKEFVLKEAFDQEKAAFFARLLQERMDEDYGDFMVMDDEAIVEFLVPAKEYINYIESLINRKNEY